MVKLGLRLGLTGPGGGWSIWILATAEGTIRFPQGGMRGKSILC